MATTTTSVLLTNELLEKIRVRAFEEKVSKSEVIRKAIERYLENAQ